MINILSNIILYDLLYYYIHIILHNQQIYFIHKIHHNTLYNKLTYKSANNANHVEHIIQYVGILIPTIAFKFTMSELFVCFLFIYIRSLLKHEQKFSYIIGNHHILHHKYPKYNFGEYWLDNIFGTCYPNNDEYIYGIIYT